MQKINIEKLMKLTPITPEFGSKKHFVIMTPLIHYHCMFDWKNSGLLVAKELDTPNSFCDELTKEMFYHYVKLGMVFDLGQFKECYEESEEL